MKRQEITAQLKAKGIPYTVTLSNAALLELLNGSQPTLDRRHFSAQRARKLRKAGHNVGPSHRDEYGHMRYVKLSG